MRSALNSLQTVRITIYNYVDKHFHTRLLRRRGVIFNTSWEAGAFLNEDCRLFLTVADLAKPEL